MHILTKLLADGLMIPIILLAAWALLTKVTAHYRYDTYMRIFMAGISSYLLAKFAGALWQPESLRPFEQMGVKAGASFLNNPGFPSDHALFAMFLTLAVWYGTKSRKLAIIMFLLTILMCVGRVIALVHTPLDVVGGIIIASIGGVWYISSAKTQFKSRLVKQSKK